LEFGDCLLVELRPRLRLVIGLARLVDRLLRDGPTLRQRFKTLRSDERPIGSTNRF
jgi:hypothetical protein